MVRIKKEKEKNNRNHFLVFGFLEIVVLSFASAFDRIEYTDKNHFVGFMSSYGLWIFLAGAFIAICLGIALLILEEKR